MASKRNKTLLRMMIFKNFMTSSELSSPAPAMYSCGGVSKICERDSINLGGETYDILERISVDSKRTCEKVKNTRTKQTFIFVKKIIEDDDGSSEFYSEISHPNIDSFIAVDKFGSNKMGFICRDWRGKLRMDSYLSSVTATSLNAVKELLLIFQGICKAVNYTNKIRGIHTELTTHNIVLEENNQPILIGLTYIQRIIYHMHETFPPMDRNLSDLGYILDEIEKRISWNSWQLSPYAHLQDEMLSHRSKLIMEHGFSDIHHFIHKVINM